MRYVAFFRGINVGGKNIVKMAELKQMFADLGFTEVKNYIQSGNICFSCENDEHAIKKHISEAFEAKFGFPSAVVIRSQEEMEDIVYSMPFAEAEIAYARENYPEVEHIYIYLSDSEIDKDQAEQLLSKTEGEDKIHVRKREIYFLCVQGIRNSKMAASIAKLPQQLTARNYKTMGKINSVL